MWKFKKMFALVAVLTAVGLFSSACTDPDPEDDPVEYRVVVRDAGVGGGVSLGQGTEFPEYVDTVYAFPGDRVYIHHGNLPEDARDTDGWSANMTGLQLTTQPNGTSYFTMPERDLILWADWEMILDGLASVRYVWEAVYADSISYVYTSESDIEYWYEHIYGDLEIDIDDFTAIPEFDGNPLAPSGGDMIAAKSQFIDIDEGQYTAVLSYEDEFGHFDIVVNYEIEINYGDMDADGDDTWWELAFDIGTFISDDMGGDPELAAWFEEISEDSPLGLEKRKNGKARSRKIGAQKIENSAGTMNVTYYLLYRPKN